MRYIIDCDPGHDDAVAILWAARMLDIAGITTVYGNASVDLTTRNALDFLALAALDIPVFQGADAPLRKARVHADVHGKTGLDGGDLPGSLRQPEAIDAVQFIAEQASGAEPVSVIATGPLTNIARALTLHPHVQSGIASLSIMGGSAGRGNSTPVAEFNAYCDPEALDIVLASHIPVHIVGYDLTSRTGLSAERIARLQGSGRRVASYIGQVMDFYRSRQMEVNGIDIAPQHDACAVLPFVAPHLARYAAVPAAVELLGSHTAGMVVFDQRPERMRNSRPSAFGDRRPVNLCVGMDGDRVIDLIMEAILSYP